MKIYDFTRKELEHLESECNFTPDELALFRHRAKGTPLEMCAELMNVSHATAKRISNRIRKKIEKVSRN
jgi:predicted DNA-binding protein (UPF0251 family)